MYFKSHHLVALALLGSSWAAPTHYEAFQARHSTVDVGAIQDTLGAIGGTMTMIQNTLAQLTGQIGGLDDGQFSQQAGLINGAAGQLYDEMGQAMSVLGAAAANYQSADQASSQALGGS